MLVLKRINESEEDYKLLYYFIISNGPSWKQKFIMTLIIQGQTVPKQNNLSDYEYFKILKKLQKEIGFQKSEEYLLLKNGEPVSSIYVIMRNKNIADISFATLEKYRRQGYATKALTLIENILFNNSEIIFTTITDITKTKISSKIATKNGYTYSSDDDIFIKVNPKKDLEELMKTKHKI